MDCWLVLSNHAKLTRPPRLQRGDHREGARAATDHQSAVLIGLMITHQAESVPSAPRVETQKLEETFLKLLLCDMQCAGERLQPLLDHARLKWQKN